MGIAITNGPSDTMIIDVTPDLFPWRIFAIGALILLLGIGIAILMLTQYAPHSGSGGGHGGGAGGSAGAVGPLIGAAGAAAMARQRVKKITLSPQTIEITRATAKQPEVLTVSQIKGCTVKRSGKGGWFKLEAKYGKKITTIAAPEALFPVLKAELQKRYSFPINET